MLGGIFISYRREDSGGYAGRIFDRLTTRLGHDNVFYDVDAIPPGRDFVEVLSERVGKCDVLLAVIGKHWISSLDAENRRRLDDPQDFVRIEIEAALKRGIPVIPVLVDGAPMPRAEELPDSLKALVRRQAVEISHTRFDTDAERLTEALAEIEGARGAAATAPLAAAALAQTSAAPQVPQPRARGLLPYAVGALALAAAAALGFSLLAPRRGEPPAVAAAGTAAPAAPAANVRPPAALAATLPGDETGWTTDFGAQFRKHAASGAYPDKIQAKCEDGVLKFDAHFAPVPPGVGWRFFNADDDGFDAKKAELKAKGFEIQYDNVFKDCEGRTRHQALWTKGR